MVSISYEKHEVLANDGVSETDNERLFVNHLTNEIIIVESDACVVIKF